MNIQCSWYIYRSSSMNGRCCLFWATVQAFCPEYFCDILIGWNCFSDWQLGTTYGLKMGKVYKVSLSLQTIAGLPVGILWSVCSSHRSWNRRLSSAEAASGNKGTQNTHITLLLLLPISHFTMALPVLHIPSGHTAWVRLCSCISRTRQLLLT